jgi:hypothetical protein
VTLAADNGCTVGIVAFSVCAALLFAATTWPGYILFFLNLSESSVDRVQRAVVKASLAILAAATAGIVLLAVYVC